MTHKKDRCSFKTTTTYTYALVHMVLNFAKCVQAIKWFGTCSKANKHEGAKLLSNYMFL